MARKKTKAKKRKQPKKAARRKVQRKAARADLGLEAAVTRLLAVVERLEKLLDRHEGDSDRPTVAMGEVGTFCPSCGASNPTGAREVGPCDDPWHEKQLERYKARCPSCGASDNLGGAEHGGCIDPWHGTPG